MLHLREWIHPNHIFYVWFTHWKATSIPMPVPLKKHKHHTLSFHPSIHNQLYMICDNKNMYYTKSTRALRCTAIPSAPPMLKRWQRYWQVVHTVFRLFFVCTFFRIQEIHLIFSMKPNGYLFMSICYNYALYVLGPTW